MSTPKYPRVMVSGKRHDRLSAEARKAGKTIQEIAEAKFKAAEKK